MEHLPVCNVPMPEETRRLYSLPNPEHTYLSQNDDTYYDLRERIQNLIGADCWAVVVNDELLFSSYNISSMTIREHMEYSMIRDLLYTRVHWSIFDNFNRSNKVNTLDVYMFSTESNPWKVHVEYEPTEKKYTLSYFIGAEDGDMSSPLTT